MKKRNFTFTRLESENTGKSKSPDWNTLKSKYSGDLFFRNNYFNLLRVDFRALENKNKWFLEQILNAGAEGDLNMLPALKRIAADKTFDENIRQRAIDILENPLTENKRTGTQSPSSADDKEIKLSLDSKKILAGIRKPSTTEILQLLRVKSIDKKRIAIFLIGKFRLSELLPEVCECLRIPVLVNDTISVLEVFGAEAGDELRRFYYKSSGNISTSGIIVKFLSRHHTVETDAFLFELVWSGSRQIRETVVDSFIESDLKVSEENCLRILKLIHLNLKYLAWIISVKVSIRKYDDHFLTGIIDRELKWWELFVQKLFLVLDNSDANHNNFVFNSDDNIVEDYDISEKIKIIFDPGKPFEGIISDLSYAVKSLNKLGRFFPVHLYDYYEVVEEILNSDYNAAGILTKASVLRNIPSIENSSLKESVIALLFSPEEIIREEAVKLVIRTNAELYSSTCNRIPLKYRHRLDKIAGGVVHEKDLKYEKILFLLSVFPSFQEEELLFLAGEMTFSNDCRSETEDSVIWSLSSEKDQKKVLIICGRRYRGVTSDIVPTNKYGFYILTLGTLEIFYNLYPERSPEIIKYIDDNEDEDIYL